MLLLQLLLHASLLAATVVAVIRGCAALARACAGVLACSPGLEAGDLVTVSVALEKPGRYVM